MLMEQGTQAVMGGRQVEVLAVQAAQAAHMAPLVVMAVMELRGGYTFNWNNSDTTENIVNLDAGTYTVTVTEQHACTATVNVVSNFATAVTALSPTCYGYSNGSAYAMVTNGTRSYTYNWNSGGVTDTINNISSGTYFVTVTDASNCQTSASATVNDPVAIATQGIAVNPTCAGGNNGQAMAMVTGGTPNYTYTWSSGAGADTAVNLIAGTYTITVSDANQCTATATAILLYPVPMAINFVISGILVLDNKTVLWSPML